MLGPLSLAELLALSCNLPVESAHWSCILTCSRGEPRAQLITTPTQVGISFPAPFADVFRATCVCGAAHVARAPTCIDEQFQATVRALLDTIDAFNTDEAYMRARMQARIVAAHTRVDAASAPARVTLDLHVAIESSLTEAPLPGADDMYAVLIAPILTHGPLAFSIDALRVHHSASPMLGITSSEFLPYCMPALFLLLQRSLTDTPECTANLKRHEGDLSWAVPCYGTSFRPPGAIHKRQRLGASGFANTDMFALELDCVIDAQESVALRGAAACICVAR